MRILADFDSLKKRLLRFRLDDKKILFFDYDGTLAPFVKERDEAYMYDELVPLINELMVGYPDRVIFVSGRSLDSLIPLLSSCLERIPQIWGSHGNERYLDGKVEVMSDNHREQLEVIKEIIEQKGLSANSEQKVVSVTLHKRGICSRKVRKIEETINQVRSSYPGLEIKEFDGGYEILTPHKNKGHAVKRVLEEYPHHLPLYFGDDLTDEDAFVALKEIGITFLVRKEFRKTDAHIWIKPPDGIIRIFKEGICQTAADS